MLNDARVAMLLQYLAEDANDSFSRYALALEYQKANQFEAAITELETLLHKDPEYLATYYQLAVLYAQSGQLSSAISIINQGQSIAKKQGNDHTFRELGGLMLEFDD